MAKETKRISINKLEALLEKETEREVEIAPDVNIRIKKRLSLAEMLSFVNEVVESCVDVPSGEYLPELREFAIRANVLTRYANFTLPTNVERKYELVFGTSAYETVICYIDTNQLNEIRDVIDRRVSYVISAMTSAVSFKTTEMLDKVGELTNKVGDSINEMNPEELDKMFKGTLSGITKILEREDEAEEATPEVAAPVGHQEQPKIEPTAKIIELKSNSDEKVEKAKKTRKSTKKIKVETVEDGVEAAKNDNSTEK